MGFSSNLYEELEKNVRLQQPVFELKVQLPYFKSSMDYTLHFRRSDQADMYFFNKYDATLKLNNGGQDRSQTFYIHKNSGFTAREAYNLLNGRAVHKELMNVDGQRYKAWLQLDFKVQDPKGNYKVKQFHENYGFNLEKTLQQFPIRELEDPQKKEQVLKSLQKGNVQLVTAVQDGQHVKRFIEASPQYKTIHVFDERMKPVKRETIQIQETPVKKVEPSHKKEKWQEQPTEVKHEKKRSHKKGLSL